MQLTECLQTLRFALLLIALCGGSSTRAQDNPPPDDPVVVQDDTLPASEQQQTLNEEKDAIAQEQKELDSREAGLPQQIQDLQNREIDDALLDQARSDAETARLRYADYQTAIKSATATLEKLKSRVKELETREQLLQNPARQDQLTGDDRAAQLQQTSADLVDQRAALQNEQRRLENLQQRLDLATRRQKLAEDWQAAVAEAYQRQRAQRLAENQKDELSRLQQQLQDYLEQADALRQRLDQSGDSLSEARRRRLAAQLRNAEERAQLAQLDINLFSTQSALNQLDILVEQTGASRMELQNGMQQLDSLLDELDRQAGVLKSKLEWAKQQRQSNRAQSERVAGDDRQQLEEAGQLLDKFIGALEQRLDSVQTQSQHLERVDKQLSARFGKALSADLLSRKTPPASVTAWRKLLSELADSPQVLFYQTRLSVESAYRAIIKDTNPWRWAGFLALGLGFTILLTVARRGLRQASNRLEPVKGANYSNQLLRGSTELLQKNYWSVGFVIAVLLAIWIFQVPQPGQGIIATLVLMVLGSKIAIDLAAWLLIAPHLPSERRDPVLYRRWFITLLVGGVLATLTLLAHLSAVPKSVIGFFDWLCMLYFLLVNGPVLLVRRHYIEQLSPYFKGRYWFMGLRLVTLSLPVSLLGAALVGLVGYINLAWTFAWHLALFTLVVSGWWLLRGILNDLAVYLKNLALVHSSDGLLWTQEIIRPVHFLVRVALLIGALWVLSMFYGLTDAYLRALESWKPVLLAMGGSLLACVGIFVGAGFYIAQTESTPGAALIRHARQPLTVLLPAVAALVTLYGMPLDRAHVGTVRHALVLTIIFAVAWGVVRLVSTLEEVIEKRYRIDAKDNFGARRVQTQVRILRRIVVIAVYLIGISAMLMTFPTIRQLGAGLLASAGVAGLVAGVAARPFLENLIAGIQIGLTQPIRLDDVVIVEGEWGKIAEINATYVVIRIWDERRLVVPLNYFNTQPFQNWTRSSSDLLGTAFFYVDYTFPVEEGRKELKRILDASNLWDGRAWGLQVTDATAQTVELRALMSAADASIAWDLRCLVREKFIAFLQQTHPDALPKTRALLGQGAFVSQLGRSHLNPAT
ncbi:MAG: mechanosensitive ion channel [Gammaproteobacteria bacterium]|nr:mechanosensitive ion channel [Gammaproteobacteria bacterium]MCP5459413.1 mechanosensitive ion channel [Gammaproteobacteria bacterium]